MSNLRNTRIASKLTQRELSERSGVNIRLIQDYEQGHKSINNAKAITVHRLAQELMCDIADILEL